MTATGRPNVGHDTLVVAVGDLHGCLDQLRALGPMILAAAAAERASRRVLVYLGDYVDRGPDSRGVIAALLDDPLPTFATVHLKGNHEDLMHAFLVGAPAWPWLMNGGVETCVSYGVEPPEISRIGGGDAELRARLLERIPPEHLEFLERLTLTHREGDYLFVHAGIRPGVALDTQAPRDLLWIRDLFLASEEDFGAVVVHGHTPTRAPQERANRIGIDTGACYGGALTALVLAGARRRFLQV